MSGDAGAEAGLRRLRRPRGRVAPSALTLLLLLLVLLLVLVLVLLLLVGAAAVSLVALGGYWEKPLTQFALISSRTKDQLDNHSPDTGDKQETPAETPSVLLTAPHQHNAGGESLQWESKLGNTHCRGGFSYSGGILVVPRDGIYRVSLQITYDSKGGRGCAGGGAGLRLSSSVIYSSGSYPANLTLLAAADTAPCKAGAWTKSLFTAGTFHLEAGGQLSVTSTHAELIVNAESQVFFGVDLVSQLSES